MPKPNYSFQKRQRELAKKQKKEAKKLAKEAGRATEDTPPGDVTQGSQPDLPKA
jgi:hypothetical protein